MNLSNLTRKHKLSKAKTVGRGGKRGYTSGKGSKGQKSRAGRKLRPELRDIIKKVPKKRGYKFSSIKLKPLVVNVADLNKVFATGDEVSPQALLKAGLIKPKNGPLTIKILGLGTINKKLNISGCLVSGRAKDKIIKAGGQVSE
jgi:large subunit ribosomal protein L15